MKNIILLLLPLIIFSKDIYAYSQNVETINQVSRSIENSYQIRTNDCQEYAKKNRGKYQEETIYKTCCMMVIDFDDNNQFPPENLGRMNRVLSVFQEGGKVCGKVLNDCLKKYLKDNDVEYRCSK